MLGLHCYAGLCASCSKWRLLSSYRAQACHCGAFLCYGVRTLEHMSFTSCGEHMGCVALQRVESSWSKYQTHVPSIGRHMLNHWATREAHEIPTFTLGLLSKGGGRALFLAKECSVEGQCKERNEG